MDPMKSPSGAETQPMLYPDSIWTQHLSLLFLPVSALPTDVWEYG